MKKNRELSRLIKEQKKEMELIKHQDHIYPEVITPKDYVVLSKKTVVIALRRCGVPIKYVSEWLAISRRTVSHYTKKTSKKSK